MILKVFAVRDMKVEAFLQPFFSPSVGGALRAFGDAANDKQCPFNKHPNDFVLFEIGTYDDSDGMLVPMTPVKMYSSAAELMELKPRFGDLPNDVVMANEIAAEMASNGKK